MSFKITKAWFKDKVRMIIIAFPLSITLLPGLTYMLWKLGKIFPNLGIFFFTICFFYLLGFNLYEIKYLKSEKRKYMPFALFLYIFTQFLTMFIVGLIIFSFKIKWPKYGGAAIIGLVVSLIFIISTTIYEKGLKLIRKMLIKKEKDKIIIETNKFQEKAIVKVEKMLKDLGAKYEEFKKVLEKDEVVLQGEVEVNGNYFAITIYEDAISLAAEKDEDVFILELIDYESQNKLIEDFCSKAKGIFEKYL